MRAAAGFGLATAWIPQQNLVAGILTVHIDEGRIDAIEVEGSDRAAVERRLAPLATGRPLRTAALERRLLLAGDLTGVSLGRARIVRRNGRNILVVAGSVDRVRGARDARQLRNPDPGAGPRPCSASIFPA